MDEITDSESAINFISCLKWIKKGVADPNPEKVQLSKDELIQVIKDTQERLRIEDEDEDDELSSEQVQTENNPSGGGDEFNFNSYDNDEENNTASLLGISSIAELTTEDVGENFSDAEDSDNEDDIIKPTDNLILVGHVEGDASILEVYVYNEIEESLYVHHDILLPAFPLCLEQLSLERNSSKGNYCAVGSMSPTIDIWDIDIINSIEPTVTLGKKGNRKKRKPHIGHSDAVLALAWNEIFDHVIASGSVDKTVLLWDLDREEPHTTIKAFNDKVQCLEWHRFESQTLLAGGCDNTARIFDCRSPETHQTWQLDGEAERVAWNPLQPYTFVAGTSSGSVQGFDCRKGLLWSVAAHGKEVTGLAISGQCPGLLVTASQDGLVKTWNMLDDKKPKLINEKEFDLGNIHCLELCPDSPFVITIGGDKKSNNFSVFDLRNVDEINRKFGSNELVQLVAEGNQASTSR